MRPARPSDNGFLESLYRSTRDDLRLIDAEDDFSATCQPSGPFSASVGRI